MKKILLISVLLAGVAACSDDNVVKESTVDTKEWTLDAYKDSTYHPGDNFYFYCLGTQYTQALEGNVNDLDMEAYLAMADKIKSWRNSSADYATVKRDAEQIDETTDAAVAYVSEHKQLLEGITTKEEAWRATVKLMKLGYSTVLNMAPLTLDGKMKLYFSINDDFRGSLLKMANTSCIEHNLGLLGLSADEAARTAERAKALSQTLCSTTTQKFTLEDLRTKPELREKLVTSRSTRSSGYSFLDVVADELGVELTDIYTLEAYTQSDFEKLENMDTEDILTAAQTAISQELVYVSQANIDEYNAETGANVTTNDLLKEFRDKLLLYIQMREMAETYISPSLKSKFNEYCEEMRESFSARLDKLDWMSETTRQKAKEKLDSMKFCVGYPDQWYEQFMVHPTGNSLVEDHLRLKANYVDFSIFLCGKPGNQHPFEMILLFEGYGFGLYNAFYDPSCNAIAIYPTFILSPIYDEKYSDAINYATFAVIGHEMTHGFDDTGSQYDKNGYLKNWWTNADKLEFQSRLEKLVANYNLLEIDPDNFPGVYTKGSQTLNENVADLGGFLLVYDAYMNKLKAEGYYGEELEKQERRFYEGFARLWFWAIPKEDMMYYYNVDVHALPKERVNGVSMNTDRWYELYNVVFGHNLYLKPEQRAYIW